MGTVKGQLMSPEGTNTPRRGAAGEETRKWCGTIRPTPSTCDAAARGTRCRGGPRGGTASPCFLAGVLREPPRQDRRRKPGSWTLLRGSPSPQPLPTAMTLGMGAAVTPPPGEGPWLRQALGAYVPGRARDLAGRAARSPSCCGRHCRTWSLLGKAGTGGSAEGGHVRTCAAVGCSRTRIIASDAQRHLTARTHRLLVQTGRHLNKALKPPSSGHLICRWRVSCAF